jgi:hypothetical protein
MRFAALQGRVHVNVLLTCCVWDGKGLGWGWAYWVYLLC